MTPSHVVVPVKSAWLSKINWTAIAGPAASLLVFFGAKDVTPEQIAAIGVVIQLVQSVITVIFRTYYNGTVTPASIGE